MTKQITADTIKTDPKTIEYVKQIDLKEITFENILKKAVKFESDALRDLEKNYKMKY